MKVLVDRLDLNNRVTEIMRQKGLKGLGGIVSRHEISKWMEGKRKKRK